MKVTTVVGTRPEIIRLSRVIARLEKSVDHVLVHTGQNWDYSLNQVFFEDLGLRAPDHFLEAQAEQIKAQAVSTKVSAAYAAMQAGGAATQNPQVAIAGDEILKSAGWVDATPEQPLNALQPQVPQDVQSMAPDSAQQEQAMAPAQAGSEPQTGMVGEHVGEHAGEHQGYETAAMDTAI